MTTFRSILLLSFLAPFALLLSTPKEMMVPGFFADEAVYFCMIQSLAHDRDLAWTRQDLQRVCEIYPAGPVGVILKQLPSEKIVFAKLLTYPIAVVTFYILFGVKGIVIFNLILMWIIIYLVAKHWNSTPGAALAGLAFMIFSAFFPYVLWCHPEILLSFLLTVFFWNWLRKDYQPTSLFSYFCVVCLGLALTIKPPLLLLAIPAAVELIKKRVFKPFFVLLLTVVIIAALTHGCLGHLNPYEGNRRIFTDRFPLDAQENLFDRADSWSMSDAKFYFDTTTFLWNCLYFFIGRFSGILWYFFPGIALALLAFLSPSNSKGKWLISTISLFALFLIIQIPSNYHGGGGALGNRYFVSLYPLLLLSAPRLPSKKNVVILVAITAFFSGPFLVHPWLSSYQPGEFTRSGFYSRLPIEWTLVGAYPIFHPDLYRVTLPGLQGHWYFMDRQSSGKRDNGFYVQSGHSAQIMLELDEKQDFMDFSTSTDNYSAHASVRSQKAFTDFYVEPEKTHSVRVDLGTGHRKTDIYGRTRWIYHLRFLVAPSSSTDNDITTKHLPVKVFFRAPVTDMPKHDHASLSKKNSDHRHLFKRIMKM